MTNTRENKSKSDGVIPVGIRLDEATHAAVQRIKASDDRPSVANTVERLLLTHPRIKRVIREAEAI